MNGARPQGTRSARDDDCMSHAMEPAHSAECQAGSVAFLETEGALCAGERARRIDTHAAHIFLAGDRAWKLKRAVDLGYLDFSTVERRRAALEVELAQNRRTAPDLYLAVHPLCRDVSGAFHIGSGGRVVDWLLEMRRFADGTLLDHIAQEGLLTETLIVALADRISAFHDTAEPWCKGSGYTRLTDVIKGNAQSLARYPEIISPASADRLINRQIDAATRLASLLDARAGSGRVRHGHGDLHLGNIAVLDGQPVLFDCLEFDTGLATTDVLYDLAFVVMDLWSRGLSAEANLLFNRYVDLSPQDETGVALLPLFMSVRATIRAHVLAAQGAHDADRQSAGRVRDYLALAEALLAPAGARLVAFGGLSGTGKSTIARSLAHALGRAPGARVLRSDVLRKRLAGLRPEEPLSKPAYTPQARAKVYREMARLAGIILDDGQVVVADAVFAAPAERDAIEHVATARRVPFAGLWLEAPLPVLLARIAARTNDASDADASTVQLQASYDIGDLGQWQRVDVQGPAADCTARARTALGLQ